MENKCSVTITFNKNDTEDNRILFSDIANCLESFTKLLNELNVSFDDESPVDWEIKDSSVSSYSLVAEPISKVTKQPSIVHSERLLGWLDSVQNRGEKPNTCHNKAMEELYHFAQTLERYKYTVNIKNNGTSVKCDQQFKTNLKPYLKEVTKIMGRISGFLYGEKSPDDKPWETLIKPNVGKPIKCVYSIGDEVLYQKIHKNMRSQVQITGLLHYRKGQPHPYKVIIHDVIKIDVESLPSWRDMFGFDPNFTNGMTSSEFVRVQRGEE